MIKVTGLSKRFKLYSKPSDRLREIFLRKKCHVNHDALKHVSFEVADGEALGIIGPNGAGKSTLLKTLTGVTLPDSGTIDINGRITGLLELGTGFNPELSGIRNIRDNGLLLGMSVREIEAKRQAIINFSELGDFINEPVKTYSSGMTMRLAFSIAIHADPKCFVVDEALSVGDAHFQQKCMKRIRDFREQGGSIIFVSHDTNAVKMLCETTILLDKGTVISMADSESVINDYNFLLAKDDGKKRQIKHGLEDDYGTMESVIEAVTVTGEHSGGSAVTSGERAIVDVCIAAATDVDDLTVGMVIRDRFGQDIFGTNSQLIGEPLKVEKAASYVARFVMPMNIGAGKYTVSVALHKGDNHADHCFHWRDRAATFEVSGSTDFPFVGVCKLKPTFEWQRQANPHSDSEVSLNG